MKKFFLTLISLLAFVAVGQAQSMKVYKNGELKAIYHVSKEEQVEFSDDLPLQSMKVYKNGELKAIYYVSKDDSIKFSDDFPFPDDPYNGHEYVDLGLSVKWATCNVGATQPEEYGDYFAWGETEPYYTEGSNWKSGKSNGYDWSSYKWSNSSGTRMTKYCTTSSYGTVDNKTVLEAADDAASANWGGSWRMPTCEEQDELVTKCTWTWTTTKNGVRGYSVVGPNGNSIFLPAAGFRSELSRYVADSSGSGHYWSSSLSSDYFDCAYRLEFLKNDHNWDSSYRWAGFSVRPVCE